VSQRSAQLSPGKPRKILAVLVLTAAALAAQTIEGHVVDSVTGIGIPDVSGRVLDGVGKPVPKAIIQLDHEIDNGGFR
jgi:hypothetical protein